MATEYTIRILVLVAAADQAQANTIAESLGHGPDTWRRGVILTTDLDTRAPRAYVCNWAMKPAQAQALRDALIAAGIEARGARVQLDHRDPHRGLPKIGVWAAGQNLRLKPALLNG